MSCLLGICDSKVSPNYTQTPNTNKIGGIPNWPVNVKVSTPSCQVCGELQILVVQLYCCLEKSAYHRTLYVFACSNPTCWNHQQSWTVYRCQSLDSNTQNPVNSSSKHDHIDNVATGKVADDWGVGADDWGNDADDWGNGADDWGNDADDWGDGADDWGDDANDWGNRDDDWGNGDCDISTSANVTSNLANSSDFATGNKERSTQDNGDFKGNNNEVQCSSLDGGCIGMKQLCIDDITDDDVTGDDVTDDDVTGDDVTGDDVTDDVTCGNGGEKPDSASHVLSEDMPSLSEQEKSNFLNTCQASSSGVNVDDKVLESYFINVFEEPSSQADDNYHVAKLLKDYQKREGCNVKDLMEGVSEGGGKAEHYEKTSLLHRDFMFHKFMKRLSLCPEQCIRYQWNGSALFNSSPTSKLPSACCHCGGEVVFELQLTPALINHLKFPHQTESVIEFGTVLVYTCKQSCWDETVPYRIEQVLVQPDPDHHLFKKNQN